MGNVFVSQPNAYNLFHNKAIDNSTSKVWAIVSTPTPPFGSAVAPLVLVNSAGGIQQGSVNLPYDGNSLFVV